MSMLKKMIGNQVLVDTIIDMVSEGIDEYVKKENLQLLGSPLPIEGKAPDVAFDIQKSQPYSFEYEIGIVPPYELNWDNFTVTQYTRKVEESDVNEVLESMRMRYGKQIELTKPVENSDVLEVYLVELDEAGNVKDDGVDNTATLPLDFFKEEGGHRERVKAMNLNESIKIELFEAVNKSKEDIARHLLDMQRTEFVHTLSPLFEMQLKKVTNHEPASLDAEFFMQTLQNPNATESDLREDIRRNLADYIQRDSEHRLMHDIEHEIVSKTNVRFSEDFLYKIIQHNNNQREADKRISEEELKAQIPQQIEKARWELIRHRIKQESNIEVQGEEVVDAVAAQIRYAVQMQYGRFLTDEELESILPKALENKESVSRTVNNLINQKIDGILIERINKVEQVISKEEFNKYFENHHHH
ncbi:MAG: hypothetical protein IPL35_15290 [Sphingobacteriales bacterium]|nr:hypothetical protein [Sphingobacteriales bacterium]